ncbi:hypothetical protein LCGC14_3029210, partial [marine sediment metagenome]
YRVLDAQYFRVPQRRRRVFVVGYLGDWRRAAEILFEPSCLRRNPPPSKEARQEIAPTIGGCSNRGGANGPGRDVDSAESLQVVHSLRGEGFDASEDGTGRGTPLVAAPLSAGSNPNSNAAGRRREDDENLVSQPLLAKGNDSHDESRQTYVIHGSQDPDVSEIANPVGTNAGLENVAFAQNQRDEVRLMDKAGALAAEPGAKQQTYVFRDVAASIGANYGKQPDNSNTSRGPNLAVHQMAVRRLTPLECERLQGFPDGYTDIPGASDSGRYKALGNSMAVPVMRWLGNRLQAA